MTTPSLLQPCGHGAVATQVLMRQGKVLRYGARMPLPSTLHEAVRASLFEKYGRTDQQAAFRPSDAPRSNGWLGKGKSVKSMGSTDFQSLQVAGPFPWLDTLRIRDRAFGYSGTAALMPDESFPKLTTLDLCNCGLSDPAAEILCESGWVGRLKELFVTGNPISWDWRNRLREAFGASLIE